MALLKNQDIELYIESFTSEGSGVGHFDGMAVFVSGAAAGDTAKVHIIKVKKTYAIGKAVKILNPSPSRIMPDCAYFPSCGGCTFRHISYEAELKMKKQRVEDAFSRLAKMDIAVEKIVGADEVNAYRNKAEYPVGFDTTLNIGFYAAHSHRIVRCESCALQPEIFGDVVAIIRKWIVEKGISVYNAQTEKGLLRHIYIRQGAITKEIMVCLVINGQSLPHAQTLIDSLRVIEDVKSIVININCESTNVILGNKCITLWGEDYIYDVLCGVKIRLSPLSFYQVNHAQAEKLYGIAAQFAQLDGHQTVLDMYCGAGTIGLSMADRAKEIIGVEIVPQAVEDAKFNARLNNIDNTQYFCMDAGEASVMLSKKGISADVIILDPPRKGCDEVLVNTVAGMNPDKIVYVSCDCATLARDCARFSEAGYEVKRLVAVDLFPRTAHVECVALISKSR